MGAAFHKLRTFRAMGDYERSTSSSTLAALPEAIRRAVRERAEAVQLTLAEDTPAFLTHSRKVRKSGLLGWLTGTGDPDTEHLTAVVIGQRDLIAVTHGEKRGTAVLTARLEDVDVGSSIDRMAAERGDEGVTLTGFPVSVEGVTSRGSLYVGLGRPDGDDARAALEGAVRAAKA